MSRKREFGTAAAWFILLLTTAQAEKPDGASGPRSEFRPRLEYGLQILNSPRSLRVHWVRVDLHDAELEIVPVVADDPDGEGPAEAELALPDELLEDGHYIAAINASAFRVLPGSRLEDGGWHEGRPVTISGLVVEQQEILSPLDGKLEHFWIDRGGRVGIGRELPAAETLRVAVCGHAARSAHILQDGRASAADTEFSRTLHPRSALGIDARGRWLWLVVVDGRLPGFSEGVSLRELAELMKGLGCDDALNLDGGGSSILMVAGKDSELETMNHPSGGAPRPVPIMLAVKSRSETP